MRTTIDLPHRIRQKLVAEAARKHMKGYSPIIVEALDLYFQHHSVHREEAIEKLRGTLSEQEYQEEVERIRKGRRNWRI